MGSKRRAGIVFGVASLIAEIVVLWLRGYGLGGNVTVRCRSGHVFTTLWIPAASVKSLRLGPWRVQRCPVGKHWSLVTPVAQSDLTFLQRRRASSTHDLRVP